MNLRTFSICLVFLLTFSFAGNSFAQLPEDKSIVTSADKITEELLQSMKQNDYKKFSSSFDQTMKNSFSQAQFNKTSDTIKERIGAYISKEYVDTVKNNQYTIIVYKTKFTKEPADVIVRTVLSEENGKIYVSGFWLDSPKLRN